MGEAALEIGPEQLKIVGEYVRSHIGEWMESGSAQDMVLRERVIRVEESIKSQLEMMRLGFDQMEKRFEQIEKRFEQVDKRFEQVDKRFQELRADMNYRFEQVDKRFARVYTFLSGIFITLLGGFITVIIRLMQIG